MAWAAFWLKRYRSFHRAPPKATPPAGREAVVAFLRSLRDEGKPAWQRLQAVRAVQAALPSDAAAGLEDVERTLERLAAAENAGADSEPGDPGVVDPKDPLIVQKLRTELRLHRLALATEQAYSQWITRFAARYSIAADSDWSEVESRQVNRC